jgi:aminoglycoside phosphotransferase (APT) family kinase protein
MTAQPDLPGLPAARVARWLSDVLGEPIAERGWSAEVISGGLSNVTYRLRCSGQQLVLRRPPLGPALPRAHDMQREYRVISALRSTAVPVPETIAFCGDPDVLGAPFYAMREVDGVVIRAPEQAGSLTVAQRRIISEALVDVLVDLHDVDVDAVGLSDYGRHGGYAARQLRTWSAQWERSRTRELPDMERLIARLAEAAPIVDETTLVHGDYRLDNTIVRTGERPEIAAVLDWELSTLGDPVADLATLLTYWHDQGDHDRAAVLVAVGLTAHPGFLTTGELAQRYAARTGRDLSHLDAHLALAAMKLGVILEGVHARYLNGTAIGHGYDRVETAVPALAARGLRLLSSRRG